MFGQVSNLGPTIPALFQTCGNNNLLYNPSQNFLKIDNIGNDNTDDFIIKQDGDTRVLITSTAQFIDSKIAIGQLTTAPVCQLDLNDSSLTIAEKGIRIGFTGTVACGMTPGNSSTVPFIWVGDGGSQSAGTFTLGFGFMYNGSGNFEIILRNTSNTVNTNVMTIARVNGNMTVNGQAVGSDDRYKHNETNIDNGLETVMKLSPETYNKDILNDDGEVVFTNFESGFIAQEIEEIPELKHLIMLKDPNNPDSYKYLNYIGLMPYNVKAIQELYTKNIQLENKLSQLENELNLIKQHLGI